LIFFEHGKFKGNISGNVGEQLYSTNFKKLVWPRRYESTKHAACHSVSCSQVYLTDVSSRGWSCKHSRTNRQAQASKACLAPGGPVHRPPWGARRPSRGRLERQEALGARRPSWAPGGPSGGTRRGVLGGSWRGGGRIPAYYWTEHPKVKLITFENSAFLNLSYVCQCSLSCGLACFLFLVVVFYFPIVFWVFVC